VHHSDLCKNVSLAVLFGSNDNSYTISTQSDMCLYTHTLYNIQTLVRQKVIQTETAANAREKKKIRLEFWAQVL
jgi:hypothetical protein